MCHPFSPKLKVLFVQFSRPCWTEDQWENRTCFLPKRLLAFSTHCTICAKHLTFCYVIPLHEEAVRLSNTNIFMEGPKVKYQYLYHYFYLCNLWSVFFFHNKVIFSNNFLSCVHMWSYIWYLCRFCFSLVFFQIQVTFASKSVQKWKKSTQKHGRNVTEQAFQNS